MEIGANDGIWPSISIDHFRTKCAHPISFLPHFPLTSPVLCRHAKNGCDVIVSIRSLGWLLVSLFPCCFELHLMMKSIEKFSGIKMPIYYRQSFLPTLHDLKTIVFPTLTVFFYNENIIIVINTSLIERAILTHYIQIDTTVNERRSGIQLMGHRNCWSRRCHWMCWWRIDQTEFSASLNSRYKFTACEKFIQH